MVSAILLVRAPLFCGEAGGACSVGATRGCLRPQEMCGSKYVGLALARYVRACADGFASMKLRSSGATMSIELDPVV